ncbi:uncharacterized protein [Henckelia pumila]
MDNHLARVLIDQMAQGNKCDGDIWKPQALQATLTYLNSNMHLQLTKENIKNRLKAWKKYYSVVTDVQKQSEFSWDEERKMIVVTSDEYNSWNGYIESHPEAKRMQNRVIENWNDIVLLCGRDRATGLGVETHDKGANAMEEDEENEVNSTHERSRHSNSLDSSSNKRKKAKKNDLVEVVGMIAASFQEFVASKKKEERPSDIEIHEVVSNINRLTDTERFKAIQKLMNGDVENFRLLKALSDEEKRKLVHFLINS